jgi:hypothetical protein
MELTWIDLAIVLAVVAVIALGFVIRRRLRGPHAEKPQQLDPADRPDQSQDARIEAARRTSDRIGF